MGAVTNFVKGFQKISEIVFKNVPPDPKAYMAVAQSIFKSPFFEGLAAFCKHEQGAEHFIRRVLGVSLADAKALSGELCK